jgi:protein TonB
VPLPEPVMTAEPTPEPIPDPVPPKVETRAEPVKPVIAPPAQPAKKPHRPKKPEPRQVAKPVETPVETTASATTAVADATPSPNVAPPGAEMAREPHPVAPATAKAAEPTPAAHGPGYDAALARWLERYKEYPRMARLQRRQGRAFVKIALAPDGTLVAATIQKSSGEDDLDRATLTMVRRASPFPPPPPSLVVGSTVEFTLPVTYSLERS